jgi:hypothetical protein
MKNREISSNEKIMLSNNYVKEVLRREIQGLKV